MTTTNTKTKFNKHHKKLLLTTILLIAILLTTLLIYTISTHKINENPSPPTETPPPIPKITIQVKSETELNNAINNTTEPTIITLNTDIKLTNPLTIPNH